ncbi:MAG: PEP-CTERM sorting domain-containing protein [Caenispirillum sp.]|nr:PEP-CTERM sorting domain-containing protein [Caenispirillum sp.]
MSKRNFLNFALAAAAALTIGAVQASTVTISNGSITARINDAGTFAEYYSDSAGSPSGSPGLSYLGVEYVNYGTPLSWYTLRSSAGINDASLGANPFGATTYAVGTQATTTLGFGGLTFMQTAVLTAANVLSVTVNIANYTGRAMSNVLWGVGFDPDQGIALGGGFATDNTILGQGSNAAVRASYNGHSVTLRNTTGAAANAITAYIDPLNCCAVVDPAAAISAAQAVGTNILGDSSISLAYDLGTLGHGQSVTVGYEYVFAVPEPGTYGMLLAGLALIGVMVRRRTAAVS